MHFGVLEAIGHFEFIFSVFFDDIICHSPPFLLCSYDDKGRKLTDWKGHKGAVRAMALSRDLKTLVTGGDDKCVRVWDVHSAEENTLPLRGHADGIQSICMAPGGDLVASASDDRTVRLWDLSKTGKDRYVGKMEHADKITSVFWIRTKERASRSSQPLANL